MVALRASLSKASPRAAHSASADDISASNDRPNDWAMHTNTHKAVGQLSTFFIMTILMTLLAITKPLLLPRMNGWCCGVGVLTATYRCRLKAILLEDFLGHITVHRLGF
eukprot:262191-Prorocentrum_minimum.AAC.2